MTLPEWCETLIYIHRHTRVSVCVPANANWTHMLGSCWVLACQCLCMPSSEWCMPPYLSVAGHMMLVRHEQTAFAFRWDETLYPWVFLIVGSSDQDSTGPKLLPDSPTIYTLGYFPPYHMTAWRSYNYFSLKWEHTVLSGCMYPILQCFCSFCSRNGHSVEVLSKQYKSNYVKQDNRSLIIENYTKVSVEVSVMEKGTTARPSVMEMFFILYEYISQTNSWVQGPYLSTDNKSKRWKNRK